MQRPNNESSDMFRLSGSESIPPVEEVLLPPDEVRRQRTRKLALASVVLVSVAIAAVSAWWLLHARNVSVAVQSAMQSGTDGAIREALETLRPGERPALRARLLAMLALDGGGDVREAQSALAAVGDEENVDVALARAYLFLAEGRQTDAVALSAGLVSDDEGAETAYARARIAWEVGDERSAAEQAALAVSAEPEAERYTRLLALSRFSQDATAAIALLTGDAPLTVLTRAELLLRARSSEGSTTLTSVEGAAFSGSAGHRFEIAQMEALLLDGREADVRERLHSFDSTTANAGALTRLALLAAIVEDAAKARSLLEGLSIGPYPVELAQAHALLDLQSGNPSSATTRLASIATHPFSVILLARATRDTTALQALKANPNYLALALATELTLAPSADGARALLQAAPTHPRFVALAAHVLAETDANAALRACEQALAAHAGEPNLRAAKGDALLSLQRYDDALTEFEAASSSLPNVDERLAEAALRSRNFERAKSAFAAALERNPSSTAAILGSFEAAVGLSDFASAEAMRNRVQSARIARSDSFRLAEADFLVRSGTGNAGATTVLASLRTRSLRNNAELRFAVAELYLQAERYRQAAGMYEQAGRVGGDALRVHLGRALAFALDNRGDLVVEELESARNVAGGEDLDSNLDAQLVRARVELNVGRAAPAKQMLERILAARANDSRAQLYRGEALMHLRSNPDEAFEAAILPAHGIQPLAWANLALRAPRTERACDFAKKYLRAAGRTGELGRHMAEIVERCL